MILTRRSHRSSECYVADQLQLTNGLIHGIEALLIKQLSHCFICYLDEPGIWLRVATHHVTYDSPNECT